MIDPSIITKGQQRVLIALDEATRARGFAPTLREISTSLGLRSTNAVSEHLEELESKGLVTRRERSSRTLAITELGRASLAQWNETRTA